MTKSKRAASKKGGPKSKKRGELADEQLDKVSGGTTIGSATGGAGAGKAKFNEFVITKPTDSSSS
jgi:hypothetical protein